MYDRHPFITRWFNYFLSPPPPNLAVVRGFFPLVEQTIRVLQRSIGGGCGVRQTAANEKKTEVAAKVYCIYLDLDLFVYVFAPDCKWTGRAGRVSSFFALKGAKKWGDSAWSWIQVQGWGTSRCCRPRIDPWSMSLEWIHRENATDPSTPAAYFWSFPSCHFLVVTSS